VVKVVLDWGDYYPLFGSERALVYFDMICADHKLRPKQLTVNIVDEKKIVEINTSHLQHDYPTDIITFNYNKDDKIFGELYICAPFVEGSAKEFNVSPDHEFTRVLIHGILHLVGHDDATDIEKDRIRTLEQQYLQFIYK
jgi:probable rRNA maturation factor